MPPQVNELRPDQRRSGDGRHLFDENDLACMLGNIAFGQVKIEHAEDLANSAEDLFNRSLSKFAEQYKLSARETEIAGQILRGRTVNYIAEQLYIAPGTVKTHTHNIYSKLGVHNKMELLDAFEKTRT